MFRIWIIFNKINKNALAKNRSATIVVAFILQINILQVRQFARCGKLYPKISGVITFIGHDGKRSD